MTTQTAETQAQMSPSQALQKLIDGNLRFTSSKNEERDLIKQISETESGQYPFATILHCIDSRVSAELIFDQGIGDIFSIRIAGNFVNEDILGSMEFACKLAGTKLLMVMGHTQCGAVKGACDHAEMGNLTSMLSKITPIVDVVEKDFEEKGSSNAELVQRVADDNVTNAISMIRSSSPILAEMEANGELMICGAMYDISTGQVKFSHIKEQTVV